MKTEKLLEAQRAQMPSHRQNNITSYIASFFSIVFSMSLVEQATHFIDEGHVLILIILFIVLFLVFNEYHKVMELRKRFLGNKNSLLIIIFAFSVNILMSAIGIYLWTNKTFENTVKNSNESVTASLEIEKKYNAIIDSIKSISPKNDIVYQELGKELSFWKSRKPANLEERTGIRNEISTMQSKINEFCSNFEISKNKTIEGINLLKEKEIQVNKTLTSNEQQTIARYNNVAMVFFIMVILTKLTILFLAKEYADTEKAMQDKVEENKEFISQYKILTEILLRKEEIEYNDVLFSVFNISTDKERYTKSVYYFFGELGILKGTSLEEAQEKLKIYHETLLNI